MKKTALIWLCLCAAVSNAYALRCGTDLVSTGDYHFEVLHKCGAPEFIDERIEYKNYRVYQHPHLPIYNDVYGQVVIQEWTYNYGRQRFMQLLRFENGKLVRIKTLDYGY